jgi:ethanolamine utilization protein EutQ (cupin superfamily)
MDIKVIRKSEAIARKISDSYQVINFLTREASENVSLAIGQAENHSETTKNVRSDRIYYIIEGKLVLKQGGNELVAEPGDVVFIPKNTEYGFGGSFRAILINSPAFNPEDERISQL